MGLLGSWDSVLAKHPYIWTPQRLQLLKLDLFWLWGTCYLFQLFCWCCVYKTSCKGVNLQFLQLQGEILAVFLSCMAAVLNYGFSPTSAFQHLVLIYTSRHFSGTAQRAVLTICVGLSLTLSCLPTDGVYDSPWISPSVPNLSPYWWGDFCGFRAFLSFRSPQSSRSICFLSSFLPSLFHPKLLWNLFVLVVSKVLAILQQVLCENRSFADIFLMHLWERSTPHPPTPLPHDSSKLIIIYICLCVCMCVCSY